MLWIEASMWNTVQSFGFVDSSILLWNIHISDFDIRINELERHTAHVHLELNMSNSINIAAHDLK